MSPDIVLLLAFLHNTHGHYDSTPCSRLTNMNAGSSQHGEAADSGFADGAMSPLATVVENSATTADSASDAETRNLVIPPPTGTIPPLVHRMTTRLRDHTIKPKEFTDGTVRYPINRRAFLANTKLVEPTDYIKALQDENRKRAMDDEYRALIKNETWCLVPSCRGVDIIDCKWVFKLK